MSPIQVILCFIVLTCIVLPSYAFRSDYVFVETTKGYYKYHSEGGGWNDAISNCKSEGAQLFYPENETEIAQVISVLKATTNIAYDIMIGMSDLRKHGVYETVDGRPASEVYNKWRKDEPSAGPQNEYHCAYADVKHRSYKLYVYYCEPFYQPYICKFRQTEDVTSFTPSEFHPIHKAIEEMKELFVDSGKIQAVFIERQTAALERQAAALERIATMFPAYAHTLRGSLRRE